VIEGKRIEVVLLQSQITNRKSAKAGNPNKRTAAC
jgi:hypothetical protein